LLNTVIDPKVTALMKILLLVVAIISLIIYIQYAKRAKWPLISLKLFQQGDFKLSTIGSFFARLTLTAHPFLVPLLIQAGYGYNAFQSGLLTVPVILSTLLAMFFVPRLVKHFNNQKMLILTTLSLAITFCSFYWQAVHLNIPLLVLQQLIMGFLMPLQFGLMNNQAYESLSGVYISQGTSVYSGIIQVSGSFGIALAALVMIAVIGPNDLQHQVPLIAFKTIFIVQNIYMFSALLVFIYQYRNWKIFSLTNHQQ
jgi:hypothetical protein